MLNFYGESPSFFIELPLNAKLQTYSTNLFENNAGVCVQDHGLFAKERVEEQPRPPVKANDYSSSSESSESSEECESGEGVEEEESPTDR